MKSALRPINVLFFLFEICVFGDAVKAETVSVIEGDSVTLHTDVAEIQRDDVIEWRLNGYRIARISGDPSRSDGVFRDGLKLDKQTGDIKITNIKTTDSGEYILKITSTVSSDKTFSVSVVSAVDAVKSVSVTVGDSVTLNSRTNIQRDDVIEWRFADHNSPIAEINRKTGNVSTYDGPDEIFRYRLQLDYWTGSLTIRNITNHHSGLYEAGIRKSSSGYTIHQSYSVTLSGERKPAQSVMEGYSVTLHTDLTEINTDDLMLWMFEDSVIAEINKAGDRFSTYDDDLDGRFRGRLKLDHQTGSLTITDTRFTDSRIYEVKIISSRFTRNKRITVTVTGLSRGEITAIVMCVLLALAVAAVAAAAVVIYYRRWISELKEQESTTLPVMEGESVPLIPEIPKDEDILWRFGGDVIAERKGSEITVNDVVLGGKFEGRLELDKGSGTLIIKDITTTHSGHYELCSRSGKKPLKTFYVSVFAKTDIMKVPVKEGESVSLPSGVTGIQKDDEILWKFGLDDSPIAQITGGTKKISRFAARWRFIFRLKLDHQTGSLTITKTKIIHSGCYVLYISKSGKTTMKLFKVKVFDKKDITEVPVKEGGSVTLKTGVTGIQKNEHILWKFNLEDSPIAQITGETMDISFSTDERFRDILKLDNQTGSLTITKNEIKEAEFYVLNITDGRKTTKKLFKVKVIKPTENSKDSEENIGTINNPEDVPLRSVETFPDSRL